MTTKPLTPEAVALLRELASPHNNGMEFSGEGPAWELFDADLQALRTENVGLREKLAEREAMDDDVFTCADGVQNVYATPEMVAAPDRLLSAPWLEGKR